MDLTTYKARLNKAFFLMRKEGLIARQSFMCCQNCAGYDIATRVGNMSKPQKEAFKGCAFYTKQDADRMKGREARFFNGLYIAYGPVDVNKDKEYGLPMVEVGKVVKTCLEAAGLEVEWNGDGSKRILVRFSPEAS